MFPNRQQRWTMLVPGTQFKNPSLLNNSRIQKTGNLSNSGVQQKYKQRPTDPSKSHTAQAIQETEKLKSPD